MPLTAPPTPSTEGESKRFKQLFLALEKALSESQKQVDCHEAVSECYNENISMFASSTCADNINGDDDARDMLASLVSERLQRINERVKENLCEFLEQNDMKSKLLRFEQALEEHERLNRSTKHSEEQDKRSAQLAAENTTLPEGVKVEDILKFHAYRLKQDEKQKLLAELSSIEAENKAIEQSIREKEIAIEAHIDEINKINESMADVADHNSFSGS